MGTHSAIVVLCPHHELLSFDFRAAHPLKQDHQRTHTLWGFEFVIHGRQRPQEVNGPGPQNIPIGKQKIVLYSTTEFNVQNTGREICSPITLVFFTSIKIWWIAPDVHPIWRQRDVIGKTERKGFMRKGLRVEWLGESLNSTSSRCWPRWREEGKIWNPKLHLTGEKP